MWIKERCTTIKVSPLNNLPVTRACAAGPGLIPGPLLTARAAEPGYRLMDLELVSMRQIVARQFVLLTETKSHKQQAPSSKRHNVAIIILYNI